MSKWNAVKIAEARQVADLMGAEDLPEAGHAAADHYASLRTQGRHEEALLFIGHALPRLEVVTWAARLLEAESHLRPVGMADRQALDRALRWLGDSDDAARRAAYEAALEADERAPERLLGFAVFFSGGSVSLIDLPPVLPPPEACARCATGAVLLAAQRCDDPTAFVAAALTLAETIAVDGLEALQPA